MQNRIILVSFLIASKTFAQSPVQAKAESISCFQVASSQFDDESFTWKSQGNPSEMENLNFFTKLTDEQKDSALQIDGIGMPKATMWGNTDVVNLVRTQFTAMDSGMGYIEQTPSGNIVSYKFYPPSRLKSKTRHSVLVQQKSYQSGAGFVIWNNLFVCQKSPKIDPSGKFKLVIEAEPPEVSLKINGVELEKLDLIKTPLKLTLLVGAYDIEISRPGYLDEKIFVRHIFPGEYRIPKVRLVKK